MQFITEANMTAGVNNKGEPDLGTTSMTFLYLYQTACIAAG